MIARPSDATAAPTQAGRVARLTTPLGQDKLVVTRLEASEGLSELFEYRIDALSTEQNINFDPAIGRNCCVTVQTYGNTKRHFCGILTEAQWMGVQQAHYSYRLILRPWLWLLGRKMDCRIFRNAKVTDIIKQVFDKGGFSDYEMRAGGDYKEIEYCVQYRETDLAFVSRLMEENGIYTFHEHTEGRHKLILADALSCHVRLQIPGAQVPYMDLAGNDRREREHIYHWLAERRFRTGKMALNDFDYMKPTTDLKADSQGSAAYERSKLEVYEYPGRYVEQDEGRRLAKVRLEAEQALDRRKHAAGDSVSLHPGALFLFTQHPTDQGEYLVVRANHALVTEAYRSGGGAGAGEIYQGHYEFLKADLPFRAPILTPKPLVHGPQTALVVGRKGKEGEEIDVDEEGRIFVQFHWNREKDKISRPVRVAQMWSGKGWGWQTIPRIGQEVVVEHLEGDPDQPMVVGTVYNKDYRYPYALPDKKTISGVKSDSTKGHGGYNEFIFDDKKGSELIGMHAQKDHDTVVENDETRAVKHDRTTKIGNDDKRKVGNDWTVDVGSKIEIKAGQEIVLKVGASKITMTPSSIKVESGEIKVDGTANIKLTAALININ